MAMINKLMEMLMYKLMVMLNCVNGRLPALFKFSRKIFHVEGSMKDGQYCSMFVSQGGSDLQV